MSRTSRLCATLTCQTMPRTTCIALVAPAVLVRLAQRTASLLQPTAALPVTSSRSCARQGRLCHLPWSSWQPPAVGLHQASAAGALVGAAEAVAAGDSERGDCFSMVYVEQFC